MNRNNDERIGAKTPDTGALPPEVLAGTQNESQATFSFATPTEFVDLPSQGRFYPEGHPLHRIDTVEIRFMTAKDEDILTSKPLLRKGLAVDRFLQNIIVNKGINISNLLVGDKNAILVAARITGYGADYKTKVTCPNCGASSQFEFDLNSGKIVHGDENLEEHSTTLTDDGTYLLKLPRSKVDVEMRMLLGTDEKKLLQLMEKRKKHKLPESAVTDQFKLMIVSVNGHSDGNSVHSFVDNMPASDAKYLRETYSKIVPNIDLTQNFECLECDVEQEMEVPFTADFFWPKG